MIFRDRADAGRRLAERLRHFDWTNAIVLALPRGGVPVAYEVATAIDAPLDVVVVRKLGIPGHEELAMGAIASGGVRVLNEEVLARLPHPAEQLDGVTQRELAELQRREAEFREGRPAVEIEGRQVILVDDGLATGATMRAAALAVKHRGAASITVAVPVGAPESCDTIRSEVDELVCVHAPWDFTAVGQFYQEFAQTTDGEVRELLSRSTLEVTKQ